jgi:outer membrane protein assembly factor BamE (lipoprotein component of BamABCDE complex)
MRRLLIASCVIVLAIVGLGLYVGLQCKYCCSVEDVFFYTIFFKDDATQFSSRYSEENFKKITKGMSKTDVVELMGEPLKKDLTGGKNFSEVWRFTGAPADRNYWFRIVLFDTDGKVVACEAKYFVD